MSKQRDTRKDLLERDRARLEAELIDRRPKLAELQGRVVELRDERAAASKRLALGEVSEKEYSKVSSTVSDGEARADGMLAVVRDAEAALADVEAEWHAIEREEALERRAAEIEAARASTADAGGKVRATFEALAVAQGEYLVLYAALGRLSPEVAAATAQQVTPDALTEGLIEAGYRPLAWGNRNTHAIACPAMVKGEA